MPNETIHFGHTGTIRGWSPGRYAAPTLADTDPTAPRGKRYAYVTEARELGPTSARIVARGIESVARTRGATQYGARMLLARQMRVPEKLLVTWAHSGLADIAVMRRWLNAVELLEPTEDDQLRALAHGADGGPTC